MKLPTRDEFDPDLAASFLLERGYVQSDTSKEIIIQRIVNARNKNECVVPTNNTLGYELD